METRRPPAAHFFDALFKLQTHRVRIKKKAPTVKSRPVIKLTFVPLGAL